MRRNAWLRLALAAAVTLAAAARAPALDVGEKAPELAVTEWVQGDPVKLMDAPGTKVWFVVFWGTFDSDCVDAMPGLNKLWEKHKAAGFDVVAISAEPADVVKRFLAENKVGYRVAIDQFHATRDAYGKDMRKLPWGWLIDKTGTVVWKGDPSSGLDGIVDEVVAGKFDRKRAQEVASRQQAMWEAIFKNDWEALAEAADKVLAVEPGDGTAFSFRMLAFRMKDDHEGFKTFMTAHVDRCKDDAKALSHAAEQLATEGGYDWRDVGLAYAAAKRAVEVSKSGDADVLETYAKVLHTVGLLDQAVVEQKKAVELEDKDDDHKRLLAYYEACLAARRKAAAPAPPPPAPPKKK